MDLGLEGKVAVVAGASKGMGRAIAAGLAHEGAAVALLGRDAGTLGAAAGAIAKEMGAETLAVPTDVTRRDGVERAIRAVVDRFRRLDILVTNAGGPLPASFDAMTDERWQQAFELNARSTVRLIRAALPHLRAAGGGRIVNLEAGVQGLVKTLADELAKDRITVNTVLPGRSRADRAPSFIEKPAKAAGATADEARRATEQAIAPGHLGKPEDVAAVVAFLCSAQARCVTGQAITVESGLTRSLFVTGAAGTGGVPPRTATPGLCIHCQQPLVPEAPAWQGDGGEWLCVPCAMGLALPDRPVGGEGGQQPRYALPPAVAAAVSMEIDLGTGQVWPVELTDFSVDGLRFVAPVAFTPETPAVVTLRDLTGALAPAVFAVEVRWVRAECDERATTGTRVIAAVDGHHGAFLARVLERVGAGPA